MQLPDAPVCFTIANVCRELSLADGTVPKGLEEVLHRMRAEDKRGVMGLDQVRVDVGLDQSSWAWRSAKALTGALVDRVWSKSPKEEVGLVWMDNLETRSNAILAQMVNDGQGDNDNVVRVGAFLLVPLEAVLQDPKFANLSNLEKQLCLAYLHTNKLVSVGKFHEQDYVKVHEKKASVSTPFSNTDSAILQLSHLIRVVEKGVTEKRDRHTEIHKQVIDTLKAGDRVRAKQLLAREVRLRRDLDRRNGTLDNLESMLSALVGAHEDREVVRSLEAGAQALKAMLPSVAEVEEVMDETRDVVSQANEIAELVSKGELDGDSSDVLEAELEEELEKLLKGDDDNSVCDRFAANLTLGEDKGKKLSNDYTGKREKVKGSNPKATLVPS